ncbi:hypothetical protein HYDPIDRAFT_25102 [Hydnomerulius pinastri MD-312]|nr:hypothetical protein HYDPIDRAFT_25102 [Hydnomerulius pinastri MD-312]
MGNPQKLELHSVDLATWDDGSWGDSFYTENDPDELDEPWSYRFKSGEPVWVCASNGQWYQGKVVGQPKAGRTRKDESLFWCVEFRIANRVRKWFSPLNGDIKPDTPHTHRLLEDAGWLEPESEQ